jgi:hypothetical protein
MENGQLTCKVADRSVDGWTRARLTRTSKRRKR